MAPRRKRHRTYSGLATQGRRVRRSNSAIVEPYERIHLRRRECWSRRLNRYLICQGKYHESDHQDDAPPRAERQRIELDKNASQKAEQTDSERQLVGRFRIPTRRRRRTRATATRKSTRRGVRRLTVKEASYIRGYRRFGSRPRSRTRGRGGYTIRSSAYRAYGGAYSIPWFW